MKTAEDDCGFGAGCCYQASQIERLEGVITALQEQPAQPAQPAQRTWVALTDEEIIDVIHPLVMADMPDEATDYEIARAIEAKLRSKNT